MGLSMKYTAAGDIVDIAVRSSQLFIVVMHDNCSNFFFF